MLSYGVLLEPKFSLQWLKEFLVYTLIAAIIFNEHISAHHSFSENIQFSTCINLEIEALSLSSHAGLGCGIENLNWMQQPFTKDQKIPP